MTALIVAVFMNSARKNSAKRIEEYSVLNPPTSSCSASTRSNGGRVSSAVIATMKTTNGMNPVVTMFQFPTPSWMSTMPDVDSVPAISSTAARLRPSAASYEIICADARTDPSNGYFEPDDQPASITPYTLIQLRASTRRMPIGGSASWMRVTCPNHSTVPSLSPVKSPPSG